MSAVSRETTRRWARVLVLWAIAVSVASLLAMGAVSCLEQQAFRHEVDIYDS